MAISPQQQQKMREGRERAAELRKANPTGTPPKPPGPEPHQAAIAAADRSGTDPSARATAAQGAGKAPSSAGEKVVVCNKMPFPIRLRLFGMITVTEQRPNAPSKDIQQAEALPDSYIIAGTAQLRGAGRGPVNDGRRMFMGYALTEGVDKEAYDQWAKDNKDQPFIRNKLVFAMPDVRNAEAVARENAGRVTGLEAINPDGDPRMSKGVTTATEGDDAKGEPRVNRNGG